MNERKPSSRDQEVVAWLIEDGPLDAPDHLVELTLATIPQVRRLHPLDSVLRAVLAAAAAAIVAIAVVAGIASIAGMRTRDVGPPPTAAPGPSSTSPPGSVGTQREGPCPTTQVACGRTLEPGSLYLPAFDPQFSFSVPDEHWLAATDEPGHLLVWTVADNRRRVGFYRDPRALDTDGTPAPGVGATTSALLAWLRGHPELVVGEAAPVSMSGMQGQSIDIALRPGATSRSEQCAQFDEFACFPLFSTAGPGRSYELGVTLLSDFRLHLFDLPGGGALLVTLEAHHEADLVAFAERAAPVLESIRFVE